MALSGAFRSNQSLAEGAPLFDQSFVEKVRAMQQYRLHLRQLTLRTAVSVQLHPDNVTGLPDQLVESAAPAHNSKRNSTGVFLVQSSLLSLNIPRYS